MIFLVLESMENINLDVILGYRKDNVKHSFKEDYDKKQVYLRNTL